MRVCVIDLRFLLDNTNKILDLHDRQTDRRQTVRQATRQQANKASKQASKEEEQTRSLRRGGAQHRNWIFQICMKLEFGSSGALCFLRAVLGANNGVRVTMVLTMALHLGGVLLLCTMLCRPVFKVDGVPWAADLSSLVTLSRELLHLGFHRLLPPYRHCPILPFHVSSSSQLPIYNMMMTTWHCAQESNDTSYWLMEH